MRFFLFPYRHSYCFSLGLATWGARVFSLVIVEITAFRFYFDRKHSQRGLGRKVRVESIRCTLYINHLLIKGNSGSLLSDKYRIYEVLSFKSSILISFLTKRNHIIQRISRVVAVCWTRKTLKLMNFCALMNVFPAQVMWFRG